MTLQLITNGTEINTDKYTILEAKQGELYDTLVVLVHWKQNQHTPFSTHNIYLEGCKGLYSGHYFSSVVEAVENFKVRT